jgi:hypothetical protein
VAECSAFALEKSTDFRRLWQLQGLQCGSGWTNQDQQFLNDVAFGLREVIVSISINKLTTARLHHYIASP